jgi:flagellar basal-body rod modification protein FlgD
MSVMGVARGATTWNEKAEKPDTVDANEEFKNLTPQQKEMLGGQDIGQVLNKLSDPNYVDPSKQVRGTGSSKMDKDAFFKLMLTQLKYQDPTNPMKNHEMAAQLAQFSTLEQMNNMNTTLTKIETGGKPAEQFQALNLIGKVVSGDSAKLARNDFDKSHDFKFNLPNDAKTAEVKVFNQRGDIVRNFKFAELKSGENKIAWNGQNDLGQSTPSGNYRFQVEAIDKNGQKMMPKTDFEGQVTGLSFGAEGAILQVGNQSVRLNDVRQFTDPSLKSNDQKSNDITELDLKKDAAQSQTKMKEEDKSEAAKKAMKADAADLMSNVGMEAELLNQVKKDLDKAPSSGSAM